MAEAILDVTDNGLSQRQASQKGGIPQSTTSSRMRGRSALTDQEQPEKLLSRDQDANLVAWTLLQESLGYAPSQSQIRACVVALLKQQGCDSRLGRHWVEKFIQRHPELRSKAGRRQEANRFDSFTPKAVHWYFDIREMEYGWIKPENTVNVDEGGIMSGFVWWLAVRTPNGRLFSRDPSPEVGPLYRGHHRRRARLDSGIIFKGKYLQAQWFKEEFRRFADWHYITSPNGWTDNHIAVEWLEEVYLPQTRPDDDSETRLIILDRHGSHATPLDNGVFNAIKTAYRKELDRLASLTDSTPVDKVNFIQSDIHSALEAIANGGSAKKAARDWGVEGNSYNRMHGHECRKDAFSALQRLSQTQEKQLTEWILIQDALGLPPTHSQIRQFAQRMLAVKGDHTPLGKHWMQAFLRRNPAVRTQKCHHRDSARVNGASTEVIRPWFNNFFLPEILAIKPENRYNMDEAGIMEGLGENGLVVGSAENDLYKRRRLVLGSGRRSSSACPLPAPSSLHSSFSRANRSSNSGSQKISVLLVTGNSCDKERLDFGPNCGGVARKGVHSKNPATRPFGAKTANSPSFLTSSHVLQPLDLSVFSALKHYYRKQVGFLSLLTDSSPVGKQNFLSCYQKAREQALTVSNIKGGWKATGCGRCRWRSHFEPSSAGEQQQTQKNAKMWPMHSIATYPPVTGNQTHPRLRGRPRGARKI
ncbi:DDE superfamily endonuclease domain-containing protein [Hirsutella rhossiliensis]|uniref:DDE superfamily endonuclease domain-containing protein n=1 Tax=Hirsutella rhossiliensis TaxID=111463 RepID=A0A9P8SJ28_9HYPO|nr:DDE superfamily endonuclease domain-containing protein [Hirsutella rhossiliensis]KAH0962631.1 DDE superfamily endonuclease domain-containing protein [Hirsutella rhossiliensis]